MLYQPEQFEPLTDAPWDEDHVQRRIREIVADADNAYDATSLWPADDWDGWNTPLPLTTLYVGAAGVIWALDVLRPYAETSFDLAAAIEQTLEAWRADPDFMTGIELPAKKEAGFLTGESGILLVAWKLTRKGEYADALHARVRENADSETNELMWGSPGTMLAARAMHEWTGEARWDDAWRESADELRRRRKPDGTWTQRLYGNDYTSLSPSHGVPANVFVLRDDEIDRETADLLAREVVMDDGLANWPLRLGGDLVAEDGEIKVQWCAGAPGVVIETVRYLDEGLLVAGAELAWRAGPHGMEKGPNICHGTAGNGYAFLKVFERTGDELWLDRARRFAMHALEQVERRGRGRYSLFTGDVGVALYAASCIEARADYPVLDTL